MVGGELVTALAEATDTRIIPVDSEHSALFQLVRAESPGSGRAAVLTASGGPVPRAHRPRRRDPGGGARASDLGDGRADHDRLGDADEQGLRADRGAPPLRRRRTSGSTSSSTRSRSSTGSSTSTTGPRSRTSGIPTCGCRSPTRCTTPSARTWTVPDARPCGGRRAHLRGARHARPSPACASPARPARPAGTAPCVLNAADEVAVERVPRRPHPVHGDRGGRRADARGDSGRCRPGTSRSCSPSTPRPASAPAS